MNASFWTLLPQVAFQVNYYDVNNITDMREKRRYFYIHSRTVIYNRNICTVFYNIKYSASTNQGESISSTANCIILPRLSLRQAQHRI